MPTPPYDRVHAAALESVANGVVITNREGVIEWVNPAFTRMTGYPLSEVVGKDPRILKSDVHDRQLYRELWATVLAGEVWRGDMVNRRKDGKRLNATLERQVAERTAELHKTVGENAAGLTQCFSNLLDNAAKFAKPGGPPRVVVRAQAGARVRLWFEDEGIGIPKDRQERVFELFHRLKARPDSTGIGLALVRTVVERMGGDVGVDSEEGQGSRFWLELPHAGAG